MNKLDTAIQAALVSLDLTWCPSLTLVEKGERPRYFADIPEDTIFPTMIQQVEDYITKNDNNELVRVIPFYLADQIEDVDNDVLDEINPIYDELITKAISFETELKK